MVTAQTTDRTVNRRLLAFLQAGNNITTNQARRKFGITNVTARINELRGAGYAIYNNKRITSNGRTIQVFRLGTPTRKQIAAGFAGLRDPFVAAQTKKNLRAV
jgi:predicted ArsR family transcriptional regulator